MAAWGGCNRILKYQKSKQQVEQEEKTTKIIYPCMYLSNTILLISYSQEIISEKVQCTSI